MQFVACWGSRSSAADGRASTLQRAGYEPELENTGWLRLFHQWQPFLPFQPHRLPSSVTGGCLRQVEHRWRGVAHHVHVFQPKGVTGLVLEPHKNLPLFHWIPSNLSTGSIRRVDLTGQRPGLSDTHAWSPSQQALATVWTERQERSICGSMRPTHALSGPLTVHPTPPAAAMADDIHPQFGSGQSPMASRLRQTSHAAGIAPIL
jgi:hypothetical protein